MQCAVHSPSLTCLRLSARATFRNRSNAQLRCAAATRQQQQQPAAEASLLEMKTLLALLGAGALATPAAAFADEAEVVASAAPDAAAAADASAGLLFGLTPLGLGVLLSPLIFYAVFNIFRSKVNPKANFGDAIFLFAAFIIVSNILSILVFKVRLF